MDIAAALNISAATVSRALNDHPAISAATKQKVREKAAELGYIHNRIASSLRSKKSGIVGLIVPRISMFFHTAFITALQNQLHAAGYQLMIAQSNEDSKLERDLVDIMFSSRVDALVVSLALYTGEYSIFDKLVKHNIPIIFYDRVPLSPIASTYSVVGDDFSGGYLAATHLAAKGAEKIAYISGPLSCNLYRDRTLGFLKGLQEHGLSLREDRVFYHELTADHARESVVKLFSQPEHPDGVFAANDNTAIIILDYARTHGIQVPRDLKVVGYSNDPRGEIIDPAITTIDQHPHEMADKVGALLFSILHGEVDIHEAHLPVINAVTLLERESSACPL